MVGDQESGNGIFETLAEHWNGHHWSVVRTPDPGTTGNQLYAVDAVGREADSPAGGGRPLIGHFAGGRWSVQKLPAVPSGANWSYLQGIAAGQGSVWAVGTYIDPATDNNVLVFRGTGGRWAISDAPNPGGSGGSGILGGITAIAGHLWTAGTYTTATSSRLPYIAHR